MNASKNWRLFVGVILLSGMIFTGCSGNGQESSQTSSASVSSQKQKLHLSILNLISIQQLRQNQMYNLLQYRQTAVRHPKTILDFDEYFSQNPITAAHNEGIRFCLYDQRHASGRRKICRYLGKRS